MAPGLTLNDSPPLGPDTATKLTSPPPTSLSPTASSLASSPNTTTTSSSAYASTKPAPPRPTNAFEDLITALRATLGPTSGLTSEGVDVEALSWLMEEYESREEEWGRYALGDASRGYTRNLVDVGNGKSNLVSLLLSSFLVFVWSVLLLGLAGLHRADGRGNGDGPDDTSTQENHN